MKHTEARDLKLSEENINELEGDFKQPHINVI